MPNIKALALTVWDKKIFKVFFSFGCHGNQSSSSSRNSGLWTFLKVHYPRIISVKFRWNLLAGFRGEDFLSNCSRTDTQTDGRQTLITIAHSEHVVLRWAKKIKRHQFVSSSNERICFRKDIKRIEEKNASHQHFFTSHNVIEQSASLL